jgi:hypothetical protein
VQIDEGPWVAARLDTQSEAAQLEDGSGTLLDHSFHDRRQSRGYAWTFWNFNWGTPGAGEHRIRSRAFDIAGNMQPAPDDPFLASKRTYWESNGQITRRVAIP